MSRRVPGRHPERERPAKSELDKSVPDRPSFVSIWFFTMVDFSTPEHKNGETKSLTNSRHILLYPKAEYSSLNGDTSVELAAKDHEVLRHPCDLHRCRCAHGLAENSACGAINSWPSVFEMMPTCEAVAAVLSNKDSAFHSLNEDSVDDIFELGYL